MFINISMASETIERLEKDFKNNKFINNLYKKHIKPTNNEKYFKYPDFKEQSIYNDFIGIYCPMGFYKYNNKGNIKIIPQRPIHSRSKVLKNNIKNFSCKDNTVDPTNVSTINENDSCNIENFSNKNNNRTNNFNNKIISLILFLILFYFFYKIIKNKLI